MKIFGEPWDAPICEGAEETETPVGEECAWCREAIREGERGAVIPCVMVGGVEDLPWHAECFMRSILGSPAHIEGRCSCHGGSDESGLTLREEAVETWNMWTAHG